MHQNQNLLISEYCDSIRDALEMTQGEACRFPVPSITLTKKKFPMSTEFWKPIKHGTILRGLRLFCGTAVCLLLVWERAHTIGKGLIFTPYFINVNAN
jgi:hypothetical protein